MEVLLNAVDDHIAMCNVSNKYIVHFKLTQCYLSIISQY